MQCKNWKPIKGRCKREAVADGLCKIHNESRAAKRPQWKQEQNNALRNNPPQFLGTRTVERYQYREYLQSYEWINKAKQKKLENPNFSLCNRTIGLHTHHRTYVRCGSENQHDLVVLCSDCHKLFHDNYEYQSVGYFTPRKR